MNVKEVKEAIKNGKRVIYKDISYPWSLRALRKDRPQIIFYEVYLRKGFDTYCLRFFKGIRHSKDGREFDCTKLFEKNIKQLNFPSPIRAIVKTSSGEVLVGEDDNYSIEE